jgi:hypothetical protein
VLELRAKHKLTAYTHQMTFDFTENFPGRGLDRYGQPKMLKHLRDEAYNEIAVMVGDFASVDDPGAMKTLEKLKYLTPDCLDPKKLKKDSRSLGGLRAMQAEVRKAMGTKEKQRGPMGHAFITTNPLLSKDYFAPKGVDKFVLEMNEPVEHSLLKCPGRYTVKVATFTGVNITFNRMSEDAPDPSKLRSGLEEAAIKSHKMCEALRAKGYEAYEFHDRGSSIVTVGSFHTVGPKNADGTIELLPQIHQIMKLFGAEQKFVPGQAAPTVGKPKEIVKIAFDSQPVPVEVPKRSVSADYDRSTLGVR